MAKFFSGLDLGQTSDFSALVTIEQNAIPDPECVLTDRTAAPTVYRYDVRHIHRWDLGTPYPRIVADLREWFSTPQLRNTTLVIDATGVGRPVVDMVREAGLLASIQAFSITAGLKPGDGTVPKKDLVGAVLAALQTRRLRFTDQPDDPSSEDGVFFKLMLTLEKELETFRVTVTPDRNETFAAWREKDHDDLVLALALALWYGEKYPGFDGNPYGAEYDPQTTLPPGVFDGPLPRDTFR